MTIVSRVWLFCTFFPHSKHYIKKKKQTCFINIIKRKYINTVSARQLIRCLISLSWCFGVNHKSTSKTVKQLDKLHRQCGVVDILLYTTSCLSLSVLCIEVLWRNVCFFHDFLVCKIIKSVCRQFWNCCRILFYRKLSHNNRSSYLTFL